MNNKNYIIVGIVGLLIVAVGVWFVFDHGVSEDVNSELSQEEGVEGEPVDITLDFYEAWLDALRSDTDPIAAGLADSPALSSEMQNRLKNTGTETEDGRDPVLCQTDIPTKIRTRPIFVDEHKAQMHVLSNKEDGAYQAQVTLVAGQRGWLISDIICSQGETAPEREFSFEREGQLLKSVPPPLNPEYWHLVFEQDGVMGHTVPLFFDTDSTCIYADGTESVCDPGQLTETAKVFIQGEMTEAGLNVKRLSTIE